MSLEMCPCKKKKVSLHSILALLLLLYQVSRITPMLGLATEKHILTNAASFSKLPQAAYFYYVATSHMSQIGRTTEVVKTGQEIAAKF